ncbi:fumarylacetoacetate hydrolase family protein [Pseudoduganella namucuonensis]|uniref:2-keto-4-pentenoate hydratase/2-oxohepta-3-ene-1,7-dioic acid hydratase (Catechol pathway) n=1 Tax=Pseudoduganella namucuonensis TaxID=1035707 RepID=A0A1I7G4R0_9BURK|nr:fumarylacetoacetate hydrolase family protein [Pseudoduganella namucuonensis]SFU43457.1 2-keto-4-pentenoate hydratase/2-oxohepta-3-ene-1,7-dioic acid hydratase (catechol pathway) [Pseudoduganella namucuonensis]
MKYQLFTYADKNGAAGAGIAVNQQLFDLAGVAMGGPLARKPVMELLEDWDAAHARLLAVADALAAAPGKYASYLLDAGAIDFLPPVPQPGVVYCAGANYRDHVEAMGRALNHKLVLDPKAEGIPPWHFLKAGKGSLAGHREIVPFPGHTSMLDWEAELAVVIGRRASKVGVADALRYVAGYSCSNDLSARDNLKREQVDVSSPFRFDWIGHKSFNGSCPIGPFMTPAAFVESPEDLDIKLWLNGEIKQDSNTRNHLYGVADQISYLSHRVDLYPGDIILTGTPAGVGMESGIFLKRGDVMKVWIAGLGELETTVA